VAILKPAFVCLAMSTVMLTGCTQTGTAGEPTYACTPSDGGTAYPCYQVQYDEKVKEDKLYAEAETVYRTYLTEHERIHRVGGITEATPALLATTTGDYFASAVKSYQQLKEMRATATGGHFDIAWIRRAPGQNIGGSIVAITACIDTSSVMMGSVGSKPEPGLISQQTASLARVDGVLKISGSNVAQVAKC
jgi:hypothetical protein